MHFLPVAVFDANTPPALAFTRSLGRAGIPVHVYAHRTFPMARLSRYAAAFHRCPSLEDPQRFLPWLEQRLRSGEISLIAPTSDLMAFYLAELDTLLPPMLSRALPRRDATISALFKDQFMNQCRARGVRTPNAITPCSCEEVRAAAESLRYPVIIKPRSHVSVGEQRGMVVRSAAELCANYHPYAIGESQLGTIARWPELRWPMVQEYVDGALDNLYSVSGVIAPSGDIVVRSASRKILQWPPTLGVGTIFEVCRDQALLEIGTSIALDILGCGLFEIELIRSDDGFTAIDLNPRAYGQIAFEIARGFDLPRIWYGCMIGVPPPPAAYTDDDPVWVHSLPFHTSQWLALLRGPDRARVWRGYRSVLARRRVDIVDDVSDPLPSVTFVGSMLRHPGGLLRPFFASPPRPLQLSPAAQPIVQPAFLAGGSDIAVSVGNAMKLGTSLIVTWGIALGIRLLLPRYLGPNLFGTLQFADAFSSAFFIVTSLGVETYIRKEVVARTEHASQFFAGLLLARILLSAIIITAMAVVMRITGRPAVVQRLVFLFAGVQMLLMINNTYAALLHAASAVDGLAVLNVGSKLVWGLGIVLGLAFGGGVMSIGFALLASETLRLGVFARLSRRHLNLSWRIDFAQTQTVIFASLPFFVSLLAQALYGKVDVILMTFFASNQEVGWYSAAANLAGTALLMTPLIGWVLLPMTSRARARSEEALFALLHRALEAILVIAIPASLFLALSAEWLCRSVFGSAFAPAVNSLRILAPIFVVTYGAMISATALIRLERGWAVTCVSITGLVANALLTLLLIRPCLAHFGPGGAGIGAAIALMSAETLVTALLFYCVGRRSLDRRDLEVIARTLAVCAVVCAFDRLTRSFGDVRLLADIGLYAILAILFKAIRVGEVTELFAHVVNHKEVGRAVEN